MPFPPSVSRFFLVLGVVLAMLMPPLTLGFGQETAEPLNAKLTKALAAAKDTLDRIEVTLGRETIIDSEFVQLHSDIDTVRSNLITIEGQVSSPLVDYRARADKLGSAPKPGEVAESPEIAEARLKVQAVLAGYETIAKDTKLQIVRADQDANTINNRRSEAFARQLFKRESSILDFSFWADAIADLPRLFWSMSLLSGNATSYLATHYSLIAVFNLFLAIIGGFLLAALLRYRIGYVRGRLPQVNAARRFVSALDTLLDLMHAALGWPFAAFVAVFGLRFADLLPSDLLTSNLQNSIGLGVAFSLLMAFAFDAMGEGILQVNRPTFRLLPLSDWAVRRIRRRVRWMAIVLGISGPLHVIGKALYAPISITVASSAIAALLFAVITASLLMRLRRAPPTLRDGEPVTADEDVNGLDILRPILWIVVATTVICLLSGYVALAAFSASVPLFLIFMASLIYVVMTLVDAGLTDHLLGDTERRRAIASAIGVSTKNVAVTATLLSGLLRFLILAAAVIAIGGQIGFYSSDVVTAVERSYFGFQIGEITISPSAILLGVLLFVLVLVVSRLVRGWVRNTLLPRTTLDAGLQNSIATIIGYAGAVLAITVGLSEVGLSWQNVAIVAGGLSFGIGLGLQAIANNFISGLILLAERPIRVGDIIAAGGEEGFVRRISVRATEIETYDRATLIIPNSQLITGVVKNWVYGNTWSRLRITVSVGYDCDVDAIRAAMLSAAEDDPRILPTPQPRVFLLKLGDAALEFELVVVIASVETLPAVKSDLQLRILKAFRAKNIRVIAQLPAVPPPVVVSLEEALGAVEAARLRGQTPPQS